MKENVLERMERIDAKQKMADFQVKMNMDYAFKKKYAALRAKEFAAECDRRGLNYHVSVGGLDSITLLLFLRSLRIDAQARAMYICGVQNNPVTRYTADAIAEKLTREEAEAALKGENHEADPV